MSTQPLNLAVIVGSVREGRFGPVHAHTVRNAVSFPRYYLLFDNEGELKEPAEPNGRAKVLLDELSWWASALTAARRERPYAGAS